MKGYHKIADISMGYAVDKVTIWRKPMAYQITTQKEIRAAFWRDHPSLDPLRVGGDYKTDTRVAFVDYIDSLCRDGTISEALAQRATL